MPDENRIPLFLRVPPSLKSELADMAWRARVSMSQYVEEAVRDRIRKEETVGSEP